ncbi:MAG TPA: TIGR04282 family arsenosugar biosynthesis glycosyltransferase [Candidatus Synoicihabitans sp.]|nr:TIGR04282 family arsenosugar biosynthesis glycosyltransferase [Candidatus Synoicihabitans sp.]
MQKVPNHVTTNETKPVVLAMLKAPRGGEVKTRLARDLGAETAVAIYRRLVERQLSAIPREWSVEVHFTPADAQREMRAWLGSRPSYHPQIGNDLGERLIHAIAGTFGRGARTSIVIGGDCPDLDDPTLREAANALATVDVVLGPAADGGYYLIGLRAPQPQLFRGITWSSATVLPSTLARIEESGLSYVTLPLKEDVDDLASWRRAETRLRSMTPDAAEASPSSPGDL